MLNYGQIRSIAARNGIIRWLHSRKVEFLTLVEGKVIARRIWPPGTHEINTARIFLCVELAPSARICVSDLDWSEGYVAESLVENQRPSSERKNRI